jgi:signal transduction histidine kinase
VEVTIDAQGVVIRDTGVGMDPERLAEAGRPFASGEPTRRGGHGVGLSIVRRLSERFGWPVRIESEPGVGTRVEVRFPQARVESSGDPAAR